MVWTNTLIWSHLLFYFIYRDSSISFISANALGVALDGAAVVSGQVNGLAARLKEANPSMVDMHCRAHNLSLYIMGKLGDI